MRYRSRSPVRRTALAAALVALASGFAEAQQTAAPADPLRIAFDGGFIKFGFEAGIQILGQNRAFWNLSKAFAPTSGFDPDLGWGEGYMKPSLAFERALTDNVVLFGGASVIASGTVFRDVFDIGNTGRVRHEDAYLGLRFATPAQGWHGEIWAGSRPYRVGSGMLISDGGSDGFERGTLIFGPRQAFALAAAARVGFGPVAIEGFYLDANELASGDTETSIAGVKAEWRPTPDQYVGVAVGQVLHSTAPYVQAAPGGVGLPGILLDARDGLQFLNAYARVNPLPQALPGLFVSGDIALQSNDRYDMQAWAGRVEVGYAFTDLPWRPVLTYGWQTFSGDDPSTPKLERFDPLFYDGSQAGWASGTNGSFVFINTNVNAHRLSLALTLTPVDFLTLRYAHVRANELNSPLQFGQGTRLILSGGIPALIAGVPKAHLSDDILVEYTRVLTPNAFVTFGVGYSEPGEGLRAAARPTRLQGWTGGLANLVIKY